MLKSTSGNNPMLARLTAKAESHVPRTVESASVASAHSASGSRVTPEQLAEINRKIESLEKTKAEQDELLRALREHSESQAKSYQELHRLHNTAEPKIASLEATLAEEEARRSESIEHLSSELTRAIDDKEAGLIKIMAEKHKITQLKLDSIVSELSLTKAQMQSMFDSVMTSMGGALLSQNSTTTKVEELISAYTENREVDLGRIESETIVKNIDTSIEQSILAREASFPKTAKVFLELGLQIASEANVEDSVEQITSLMGELESDISGSM